MVLPDGQSPQRVNHRGWSIGKTIRVKRLPVVVLLIAIPQAHSLADTSRRFSGVMKSTSPLCAKAATIAQTISGLTPNWLEYQADCKPVHDMQRLKRSVAESEGHRIVFHNLSLTVMRKEIHIVSNPNRGGWDAKNLTQTGLQSTLIQRRKQWSGVATWQRGKGLNLVLTAQMVRFKIPTAMEITHVHPRTPGIKHFSLIE